MFGPDMRLNYDWKVTPVKHSAEQQHGTFLSEHLVLHLPQYRRVLISTSDIEISEGCGDERGEVSI